jgi:hypothetical protein
MDTPFGRNGYSFLRCHVTSRCRSGVRFVRPRTGSGHAPDAGIGELGVVKSESLTSPLSRTLGFSRDEPVASS